MLQGMELSDEDVGLAPQNTKPKQVELSDADVFGAPAQPVAELSDADVFGLPAPAPLPSAGFGTFGTSVGKSYNEFNVQKGLADRVRIQGMLQELDAGGNPDINPVKTWGAGIKFDIGRALGANVDAPEVKRQYLLNRLGEIDKEIKSSGAAVQAAGPGSQQLSDLQAGLQEAQKKDSFLSKTGAAFSALKENPRGIPEMIGGGAYTMGRPIVAGIGAAAVSQGRSLIPMAASALVSGADSYDGTMAEIIEQKGREGGIDVRKNPEAIPTLLQDANFIEAAKGEALRRGISDAAWSAISMRLGMSPKIKGVWQPIVQSAAEGATELTGQLARKGKIYDPTAIPVALTAGFAFEGPSYALGRAAGAFGKATPPPAAPGPQAQQTAPAPTPVAPQPINADDLPSVAGETVEAPAAPAPVATAPVQPELPVQPAAQPQAVAPAPAPVAPAQPAAQPATTPVATENVEPFLPKYPGDEAPLAERLAWSKEYEAWKAKHGKTHFIDGTPRPADYIEGTPEFAARVAKGSADKATAAQAQQPAPTTVAVQPEPTPAPAPQPVATAQPEAKPVAPVAPAAQAEIPGTAETFNLTGEQVAAPAPKAVDTTAEMPLPETRENPLATEARARLAKLEAAGKGDSDQAKALRRTIERETQPAVSQTDTAKPDYGRFSPDPSKDYSVRYFKAGEKNGGAGVSESGWHIVTKRGIIISNAYADKAEAEAYLESRKKKGEEINRNIVARAAAERAQATKPAQSVPITQAEAPAQPAPAPVAEVSPPQSPQAEAAPVEQPKAAPAQKPKAEPTIKEAAKAQKTDQPQTKRARTALAKAIRENGVDDKVTKDKYRAVLRALEREGSRSATAKDVSQPYLGLSEPADIKAARELLAKKAKKEGKIANEDARKAEILIEQYEAEVDLAQGQLRDEGQIKLVSDETLNRVVEHVQGMLDDGLNPDADAMNAMRLAGDEIVRRAQIDPESFGDPIADVKGILRKEGLGIPLLPVIKTEKGKTEWADTEYSGLQGNLPKELSQAGGIFIEPKVREAGIDLDRARNDATYRSEVLVEAEGMMGELMERMQELGWTQLQSGYDIIGLLSDAADGKPQVPEGGVSGSRFKGDPSTVAKLHSGDVDLSMLASEGSVNAEQQNVAEPEPEPTQEERQGLTDIQAEYENPPFDSTPTPAEQAILDAASDNMPTEESILDALDKAAAERLDPKNRSSIGPDLIAAVMWQTARDIQKGVVTFAKWAADTVRNFPSLKGSLKTIWAKAQDIAKRPIDYIRFRALDTIADKVWQNVRRNKGSATLRKIANIVFAKGGPDADAVDNDIPTRVNLVRTQFSNIYASIMERFAADFADMTPEQRRQWDADFRKHVIDGTTPTDPKLAKAVKDFRNLMRDLLAYQREAGIEMGDQGVNYFPRNYDPDAVEANRPGFVKAAIEMYRRMGERMYAKIMAEPITQEQIDTRAESLKDKDDKAGTTLRSDDEYKRIAEIQLEQTRQERADKYKFSPDDLLQKAEDWATAITHGDVLGLTLFKASEGKITSDATDARKFSNDEAKLADEFLKKNVDDIMLGYIDGAVRGAELARVFGEDGKMFEQMMNKLSNEGVDKETVLETRRLVQKALGVGREQASQATAVFFDWVNVVLAGAFLGKTAIYNLVLEPISFGVRTGNVYLAVKGMVDTWRYAIAEIGTPSAATRQRIEAKYGSRVKFEKAVTETVGEQVGLIQREMERAYFNSHWDYSSGEKGSKLAKWISQRIYRANLMSATEKAKVQASIGIARLALRDNARFLAGTAPIQKLFKTLGFDTNAEKSAAVIMRENGVPEADHKAFAAFVEGLEGKTDAEWQAAVLDPKNKMAKHYRRALQRMSLGMSIKTNPALKMEMSDSVLGRMLMQLMNYSYAYSNLIKDRMYSMAAQTVAKDASKIDRLRYAAPLMVGAPLAVLAAVGSKALISAMWPSDEMEEINKKKAAARKAFDAASFAGMFGPKIEYLVKGFERGQTPGGPVAETVFRGGQAAFAAASDPESAKKIYNAKKQAYSSTVKPLVTGGAAAVHPFFGFLGNVAVNKQEVREAVIGDKPKK